MIQDMVPYARRIGMSVYWRPYPGHFDQEEFSRGFKVLDFALFSGDGLLSTVEHIGRFKAQCAEIGHREALKLRIFPSILTGQLSRGMDSTKPSGSRTTAVHEVDIGDIDSEERDDEVYLEDEEESAEVDLAEIMAKGPYVQGFVELERRAREILTDPKARGKAKMYPEVAKVLETKVSTKEEPPKAIVLCSRCQCEVTLEVVPSKPKKLTKEPTKGLIKEQPKDQV
ncbi:unnamed protein product [Prunus brigantina]